MPREARPESWPWVWQRPVRLQAPLWDMDCTEEENAYSAPRSINYPKKGNPEMKNQDFVSVYRIGLVKDPHVQFEKTQISNSVQAHRLLTQLIEHRGQPDREQFCVLLLDTKNQAIGLNIVSTGGLTSAIVCPRDVLKPAILANAAAMVLCHNHPSGEMTPSTADRDITQKIVEAAKTMEIMVHEHLIVNAENDEYFSFADNMLMDPAT
jgi:DNA repair protein RadC